MTQCTQCDVLAGYAFHSLPSNGCHKCNSNQYYDSTLGSCQNCHSDCNDCLGPLNNECNTCAGGKT